MANANDNTSLPGINIDVTLAAHALKTRLAIKCQDTETNVGRRERGFSTPADVRYYADGVEIEREDFQILLELHTLVGRSRLGSVG